jgi:hypothetical protein
VKPSRSVPIPGVVSRSSLRPPAGLAGHRRRRSARNGGPCRRRAAAPSRRRPPCGTSRPGTGAVPARTHAQRPTPRLRTARGGRGGRLGTAAGAMPSVRAALLGTTDTLTRSIIGGVQPATRPGRHARQRARAVLLPSTSQAGSPSWQSTCAASGIDTAEGGVATVHRAAAENGRALYAHWPSRSSRHRATHWFASSRDWYPRGTTVQGRAAVRTADPGARRVAGRCHADPVTPHRFEPSPSWASLGAVSFDPRHVVAGGSTGDTSQAVRQAPATVATHAPQRLRPPARARRACSDGGRSLPSWRDRGPPGSRAR